MENKGVEFIKSDSGQSFLVEIEGDNSVYLQTIKSLLSMLGRVEDGLIDHNERYCVCNLIASTLPSEEQIDLIEQIPSVSELNDYRMKCETLEMEKEHLKRMLEIKEDTLKSKGLTIQILLKKLNHENQCD